MLKYFPAIYNDELLYSMVSRYAYHVGSDSTIHIMNELFDKYNAILSLEFPCRLERFINKFPVQMNITSDEVIFQHTMFALYYPFLDTDRQKKIYKKMLSDKGMDIHLISGSMASNIRNLKHLRYCPVCVQEEYRNYGEAYWHRSHNIEGIFFCYKHGTPLSIQSDYSTVPLYNSSQRKLITINKVLDDEESLQGIYSIISLEINEREKQLLIDIAKSTYEILNYEFYKTDCNLDKIYSIYLKKLSDKELVCNEKRIMQAQVRREIEQYYGKKVLGLLNLDFNTENNYSWVKDFLNKKKQINHPLKHILIINWLYDGKINLFTEDVKKEYKRMEDSYWPCLNPAASHYKEYIIRGYQIKYNSKKKYYIMIFSCTCGYVYTRKLEEKNNIYSKSRVIEYGDVWEKKLKKLLEENDLKQSDIVKLLKTDHSTVKKYSLKLLGLDAGKYSRSDFKKENRGKNEQVYGSRLQRYLKKNKVSKADLERTFTKEVSYLKWKNKKLLNSIMTKCIYVNKSGVDWNKRDEEICEIVRREIEKITSNSKYTRVTVSKIGKNIGYLNLLEKHIEKLPLTKIILEKAIEDMDRYKSRKN